MRCSFWRRYEELLLSRPVLVKALTSFVGFVLGDVLTQCFIQRSRSSSTLSSFDWMRLLRLASFGLLVHGPSSHVFYGALDRRIPGTSSGIVIAKVTIDQLFWSPCFSVLFFGYTSALEMRGTQYVVEKIQAESFVQVVGSWHVWPVAHAINFRVVPTEQRVLFINSVQVGYNCFLSFIANRDASELRWSPPPLSSLLPSTSANRMSAAPESRARAIRHRASKRNQLKQKHSRNTTAAAQSFEPDR